jgi:YggT family protein
VFCALAPALWNGCRRGGTRGERLAMGDLLAAAAVLADVKTTIAHFVDVFLYVYIALIFAYILTTWVQLPHGSAFGRIQRFLFDVCDPYLRLFRRFIPPIGPLDLSPMVAMLVLLVIDRVVARVL